MTTILCTLFEGNYHYGVAALTNSLIAAGYTGQMYVGYRGALPDWLTRSPQFEAASGRFEANAALALHFVPLETSMHFTYYKPIFIRDLLAQHPQAETVAYIDPDIVVKCDWEALAGWFLDGGIALSEDVNFRFPARHPKRLLWARHFAPHGIAPVRPMERYYNAGFVGVPRSATGFLDLWQRVCALVIQYNGERQLKAGGSAALFHSTDQDALNYTLSACHDPLNTVGPEGMDFAPGGFYLSHAIGPHKPWHGGHIRRALQGYAPSAATKSYWQFANAPIRVYDEGTLASQQRALKIAAAIGRVYHRAG